MKQKIKKADDLACELADLFNQLVNDADDFDLKRLFKQLEADMMDFRHKLALAGKIIGSGGK
jgi:hypothetical protein